LASRRKEEKTECGEGGINKARTVATVDSRGRTIWIADAHRDDGKRFVVHADEKLTAFLKLERITSDDDHRNQTISKRLPSV